MSGSSFSIGVVGGYGDVGVSADIAAGMDVLDAAQLTAQAFPGGVPALAPRMGVSANTLQHKLNTSNTTHHLTLKEAQVLQLVTGNASVLHALAKSLGYVAMRATPDQSGGDPVEAFARFMSAVGEFSSQAADVMRPGVVVSPNMQRRVEFQAQEVQAALAHLVASSAARMPRREGGQ